MLDNGTVLPEIAGKDIEGNAVSVAEVAAGAWTAVLFYRGDW